MKILAFVDTHGSLSSLDKAIKKSKKADLILCAGDITVFEQNLEYFIKKLAKTGKLVLIIPGNHEDPHVLNHFCKKYKNVKHIHEKAYVFGGFVFIGYGSGGFSIKDERLRKLSQKFVKFMKKHKDRKLVLLTHAPPYRTKLDKVNNHHVGNKEIRGLIKKLRPLIVVCGHLHENFGKKQIVGKTLVINPGPYGKILNMN